MKIIILFSLIIWTGVCLADEDTNIVAMSDWSKPVSYTEPGKQYGSTIRGRLIIRKEFSPRYGGQTPETAVHVELQNLSMDSCELFFSDVQGLRCELSNANDKPIRSGPSLYGNGPGPVATSSWVILPYDSSIRLRVNTIGGSPSDHSLFIRLYSGEWSIPAGDTNDYYLSGTLNVSSPTNHVASPDIKNWQGILVFPKMKILVPK